MDQAERIKELEAALLMAVEDLEAYMGSDADESETIKFFHTVLGNV